ncbi:NAD(P)/FAD-dependent oxidoreductase [Pseudoalteromonas luteoviolacea]|uniref:FAD dependent oxidoreductase domain-containing protein n=1 Tax=Pseudoalteromonas luteoviolacea S4054 TaxID=1129367 RepID=A0A0F6AIU7_9GAMM|nr:FAD-binding oxidoreductase [Pseudoalteromonas luteoviolacea]AOT11035.1 oxidoreductase [Pseudoalteromonas luteoviolacea]AOT15801.1 oxidoreductase [Pseudoalteromonas luteoviolacea]AOT20856.1 oxidoreductase [Pseudoalteromonas luteoviolacea]KKE85769.1 hypothetical protein N479_24755 [Pseudoalteromonas luteoviolacea S4054]KZN71128.1 hypothetical protein N481_19810 [Pseudoalteromonas luteoviolacea S4047-1]
MNTYDPLYYANCQGQPLPSTYWATQLTQNETIRKPEASKQYDSIVIGGGFTGLLTAYYLATLYSQRVCVVEANQVGFGASARNAGFALPTSGRLSPLNMVKQWGENIALQVYQEYQSGVSGIKELIRTHNIDCDQQESGYLKIAHSHKAMTSLYDSFLFAKKIFSDEHLSFIDVEELRANYINMPNIYGAIRNQHGFGLNPLKLLFAYKRMAEQAGVDVFEQSLAERVSKIGDNHIVDVNNIQLRSKNLLITANAYNNKYFHPTLDKKYLPILSSILVTRPLSNDELLASGLHTNQVMMDTRTLKYYYRLLPDNRLLFGGRGAVYGKDQDKVKYQSHLTRAMHNGFPALKSLNADYYWHGYIAAALDDHPHICFEDNVGYAIGYCGAGVAFSSQAALRLAQMTVSDDTPALPIFRKPAPAMPFARFSRLGQHAYYHYAQLKDRLL